MPVTPGPGGVEEEHRYTPRAGVRHGTGETTGRWIRPADVQEAGAEVAADVVLVVGGQFGRRRHLVPHHQVTEPGREALQLVHDGLAHVHRGPRRNMAVVQRMCLPSGARLASTTDGCDTRT